MRPVKTHTFRSGRYRIVQGGAVDGWCDVPGDHSLEMRIRDGGSKLSLAVAIHEGMHAEGFSPAHVDCVDSKGMDASDRIADFLWRLGWRRAQGEGDEG